MNHIQNAVSGSRSQVVDMHSRFLLVQGLQMPLRKIYHMDIIPDSRSVRRRIIIAEHPDIRQLSQRYFSDIRRQIIGDSIGIFSQKSALMRAYRIEIPQQHHIPLRIRLLQIGQYTFDKKLSCPIRIGRR